MCDSAGGRGGECGLPNICYHVSLQLNLIFQPENCLHLSSAYSSIQCIINTFCLFLLSNKRFTPLNWCCYVVCQKTARWWVNMVDLAVSRQILMIHFGFYSEPCVTCRLVHPG